MQSSDKLNWSTANEPYFFVYLFSIENGIYIDLNLIRSDSLVIRITAVQNPMS